MDGSLRLMPRVFFVSLTDPRMIRALERIQDRLSMDSLVHRYSLSDDNPVDGISGREGAFSICSFWLVEALTRAGRIEEARLMFEKMLDYANNDGVYAGGVGQFGADLEKCPR